MRRNNMSHACFPCQRFWKILCLDKAIANCGDPEALPFKSGKLLALLPQNVILVVPSSFLFLWGKISEKDLVVGRCDDFTVAQLIREFALKQLNPVISKTNKLLVTPGKRWAGMSWWQEGINNKPLRSPAFCQHTHQTARPLWMFSDKAKLN